MVVMGANGHWGGDTLKVTYDPALAVGRIRETILHEALHAIFHLTGLNVQYPQTDADSPGEDIINRLTPALLSLIRDNPEFTLWLLQ